jgi:hypothetical protein
MIWREKEEIEGMKEEAIFIRTEKRKQGDTYVKKREISRQGKVHTSSRIRDGHPYPKRKGRSDVSLFI